MKKIIIAFKYLKQHGVIHRDLKPENIIIEKSPHGLLNVKIIDFGFAIFKDDISLEGCELICGTPSFIAPEIYLGQTYDYSSDLFAIGVNMYFLLFNELPFAGNTKEEVIIKTI